MHAGKLSNTLENHWLYCLGRVGCRGFFILFYLFLTVFYNKHVEGFRVDNLHG
jgi:hypothetical protein